MELKYIDRRYFGVDYFFANISSVTSALNNLSPGETISHMKMNMSLISITALCRKIQKGIRILLSDNYSLCGLIPSDVAQLAAGDLLALEKFLPFFEWLQKIQRENEQNRIRWLASIKDAAGKIGGELGVFLESFSRLSSQRISIVQNGNEARLSLMERQWGSARISFSDAQIQGGVFPLFGFLFWIEADAFHDENGKMQYEFRFLIDLEFSNDNYGDRVLRDENWNVINIKTTCISFSSGMFDYMEHLRLCGEERSVKFFSGLESTLQKSYLRSNLLLSPGELAILPLAKLFEAFNFYPHSEKRNINFSGLEEIFENRFALGNMVSTLEKECGQASKKYIYILKKAIEAYESNEGIDDISIFKGLHFKILRQYFLNRDLSDLYRCVTRVISQAASIYKDKGSNSNAFDSAVSSARSIADPLLKSGGFSGDYPDYRRKNGKKAEFLTVSCSSLSDSSNHGILTYYFSLKIAKVNLDSNDKHEGVAYIDLFAYDFTNSSKYAHLCELSDAALVRYSYNIFTDTESGSVDLFNANLSNLIKIIINFFDNKNLPIRYVKHLLKKQEENLCLNTLKKPPSFSAQA